MKENKLIAEFMGLDTTDGVYYNHIVKEIDKQHSTLSLKKYQYKSELTHFALLKYHTSWDWLMPVVQKIEQVNEGVPSELWNVSLYSYREEVYDAVVEFIKQLNKEES